MLNDEINKMKFYPIVDNFEWIKKLVSWNVQTIQLRIKNNPFLDKTEMNHIESEIKNSIEYCKRKNCQLFINDHWELALKYNAFGIHLGYEDSFHADIPKIYKTKIKLGLSTHDDNELSHALKLNPSYIALGPIFPTKTKIMKFLPQGIEKITEWRKKIPKQIPLIAIGGIKLENSIQIYQSGADSISVIHDFLHATDPENRIKSWLKLGQ